MIKRFSHLDERERREILAKLHPLSFQEVKEAFNKTLDGEYGAVDVIGMMFDTSEALEKLKPSIYKDVFNQWIDDNPDVVCLMGEYYGRSEINDACQTVSMVNNEMALSLN